jgi:transposase
MKIVCGVDISKAHLDARVWPDGGFERFDRTVAGIDALADFCRRHAVDLVAMEATGGLERLPLGLLGEAGLACALANPGRVRDYARSMGATEKTDRIDAAMIARFALAADLQPSPALTKNQLRLKALVVRLRQVTDDLTTQKQRRSSITDADCIASLDEVITVLKRQSRHLEGEIASMIDDDPLWGHLAETFRSIKGVGPRTIARLMAEMPEIGVYSNKAIAKLAGLAPLADDSGARKGKRMIRGGRSGVRSILCLVAELASRYDDTLKAFHQRLSKAGKPKMVIRIALAHKLLVWLNAKARDARAQMMAAT